MKRIPSSQLNKLGSFYIWAQNLAGMEFPAQDQENTEGITKTDEDGNTSQEISFDVNIDEGVAQTKVIVTFG